MKMCYTNPDWCDPYKYSLCSVLDSSSSSSSSSVLPPLSSSFPTRSLSGGNLTSFLATFLGSFHLFNSASALFVFFFFTTAEMTKDNFSKTLKT